MLSSPLKARIVLSIALGAAAGCGADAINGIAENRAIRQLAGIGGTLIECPTSDAVSATATVTPLGGVVSAGGTAISIPAGALLSAATVTVTLPASRYMEVDISVEGADHFVFELPVAVTLSYARCSQPDLDQSPLTVWYIDGATKSLLAPMGGVDDQLARTVTFTTGHLSGYAVAN